MRYLSFEEIDKARWDDFVDKSPDGWLYQTSRYIDWAIREGNVSLSFACLTDGGEVVAICPLYIARRTHYSEKPMIRQVQRLLGAIISRASMAGPFSSIVLETGFAGPAFAAALRKKGRKKAWRAVMFHIDELAAARGADALEIRMNEFSSGVRSGPGEHHNQLWDVGVYELFRVPPRLFCRIDLGKPEKQIYAEIDEDCRADISKAARNGVKVVVGTEADLPEYHAIHTDSWKRTVGSFLPLSHFEAMFSCLNGVRTIKLMFAEYQAHRIAAVMLHCYKDAIFYYGGCSRRDALQIGANNYLLYKAILWAKANGYTQFGVGLFECFPGLNQKEYNVGKYKSQFGGDHYEASEGRKLYSRRALRSDYLGRKWLLKAYGRAGKTAGMA